MQFEEGIQSKLIEMYEAREAILIAGDEEDVRAAAGDLLRGVHGSLRGPAACGSANDLRGSIFRAPAERRKRNRVVRYCPVCGQNTSPSSSPPS